MASLSLSQIRVLLGLVLVQLRNPCYSMGLLARETALLSAARGSTFWIPT